MAKALLGTFHSDQRTSAHLLSENTRSVCACVTWKSSSPDCRTRTTAWPRPRLSPSSTSSRRSSRRCSRSDRQRTTAHPRGAVRERACPSDGLALAAGPLLVASSAARGSGERGTVVRRRTVPRLTAGLSQSSTQNSLPPGSSITVRARRRRRGRPRRSRRGPRGGRPRRRRVPGGAEVEVEAVLGGLGLRDPLEPQVHPAPAGRLDVRLVRRRVLVELAAEGGGPEGRRPGRASSQSTVMLLIQLVIRAA